MDIVVDANILFAALIKDSVTVELMLHENIRLYTPEFILDEFIKYKEYILKKTKRTKQEFDEIFLYLKEIITIIPKEEFEGFLSQSLKITPDKKDIHYLALALKLKIPIWSNDKELKNQKEVLVYSTKELKELIS